MNQQEVGHGTENMQYDSRYALGLRVHRKGPVSMRIWLIATAIVLLLAVPVTTHFVFQPEVRQIYVALEAEPITLDPFSAVDRISPVIQQVIFEGLLELGPQNTVLPKLATAFAVSPDGRSITFTLRPGVRFHDGSPFNAAAVKQNFEFLLDPGNQMARRYLFDFIDEIVVHDAQSITFISNRADYALPYYFAHPAAGLKSARELDKRARDPLHNLTHTAVGTGPFRLILWHGRRYVELEPNLDYWDSDNTPTASLKFLPVPDEYVRIDMLKRGQVHVAYPVTKRDLSEGQVLNVLQLPLPRVYFVGLNLTRGELVDARVRQAMNYAVNKERLMSTAKRAGLPLDSPLSPAIFGYRQVRDFTYDPARARALLTEANWRQATPLQLFTDNSEDAVAMAEAVRADLAAVGIAIEVKATSQGDLLARLHAGQAPDMWLTHWQPFSGEVHAMLTANFSVAMPAASNNNAGKYRNDQVEQGLLGARTTPSLRGALAQYAALQEAIFTDAPWLFLFAPVSQAAYLNAVNGVEVAPNGALDLSRIRLRLD